MAHYGYPLTEKWQIGLINSILMQSRTWKNQQWAKRRPFVANVSEKKGLNWGHNNIISYSPSIIQPYLLLHGKVLSNRNRSGFVIHVNMKLAVGWLVYISPAAQNCGIARTNDILSWSLHYTIVNLLHAEIYVTNIIVPHKVCIIKKALYLKQWLTNLAWAICHMENNFNSCMI